MRGREWTQSCPASDECDYWTSRGDFTSPSVPLVKSALQSKYPGVKVSRHSKFVGGWWRGEEAAEDWTARSITLVTMGDIIEDCKSHFHSGEGKEKLKTSEWEEQQETQWVLHEETEEREREIGAQLS